MSPSPPSTSPLRWIVVVIAGVVAAMHIWKLPGALEGIRAELGISLVLAGPLLGVVQVASMLLGLAASLMAEVIGLRRTLLLGLVLLAIGSAAGAGATTFELLMLSRALEGVGFLLATVVAPALIRHNCNALTANTALGWWGAFQGIAAFIAVLASTLLLTAVSWQVWWLIMAALTAVMVPIVLFFVPADPPSVHGGAQRNALRSAFGRIVQTVRTLPPWGLSLVFGCYTLQWGAVIGFLPTIFSAVGVDKLVAGAATAIVAGSNGAGSVLTGILLRRGAPMRPLVVGALATMAVTTTLFFAVDWQAITGGLIWQIVLATLFSFCGAAIPASITRLAVDVAPAGGSAAAVLGLMQHVYNAASFVGPILFAAVAVAVGSWQSSWLITVAASLLGALIAALTIRGSVIDSVR